MNAVTNKTLWAHLVALAALGLMACPTPPTPDSGMGGGGGSEGCEEDSDCGDPSYFFCNTVTAECEPSCRTNAHCNMRPAGAELTQCAGALGCQCDDAKCVGTLCSSDSECGAAQVCRSGECVTPPAATTVAKCQITPDLVVMRTGSSAKFYASAWDAQNAPVVVKDGATWAAVGTAVTGSGSGDSATFTAGTTAVDMATTSVEATFGTTKCQAKVIVLATPSAADEIAVSVIDELSGRPVAGAQVMLSAGDGTPVLQGANPTLPTNAQGYAVLNGFAAGQSVTVFHTDFSYVTVANYAGTTRFLSFALRRNALDKHGGYKGEFTNVPATSNVHAALGGMSLAGSITNLNISQLLGPSIETDIAIGSAINEQDVPIPAGVSLGFGTQQIKPKFAGLGLNGTCLDGTGAPDEANITAGTCGTRTAWALSGDVPLSDLPISAVAGGLDNINIGELLASVLPIFKKFNSTISRDVQFSLRPFTTPGEYGDILNDAAYTTQNLDFTQIPLAFSFVTNMPALPRYKGSYADGVAIIGGANVIGRGVVPLGIGVGVNLDDTAGAIDDKIDAIDELAVGQIGVRMAPTHHGLEGSQYGLLAAAISAKALNDASAGIGASALFTRLPGNKLLFDPKGATPIDLSGQVFPTFPEGAKFNFSSTADGALAGRSFSLTAQTGVQVIRVSFADDLETRWDVLVSATAPAFTLPLPPAGTRDRLFADGNSVGTARSEFVVQAFRMAKDASAATPAPISFADYVELNENNAADTTNHLTAFSFLTYAPPDVKFTTPAASGTVAKGSKLALEVSGFSIGTAAANDGVVRLTFTGGTNCPDAIVKTETMAGNGKLEYTLPADCVGAAIVTRAELLKIDEATPIVPAVARTITLTIAP